MSPTGEPAPAGRPTKLGLTALGRLLVVGGSPGWLPPDLPDGVRVARRNRPPATTGAGVTVAFYTTAAGLAADVDRLAPLIFPDRSLWVAWPRRAGGHRSDVTDNVVRQLLLPLGLVDVKVAAIDEDWSGLRFVWRRELRGHQREEEVRARRRG